MLVWEGLGALAALAAALVGAAVLWSAQAIGVATDPAFVLGLLGSTAALWTLGRRLNDPARDHVLIDPDTGETVTLRTRHSVFWIPVQYLSLAPLAMAMLTTYDLTIGI